MACTAIPSHDRTKYMGANWVGVREPERLGERKRVKEREGGSLRERETERGNKLRERESGKEGARGMEHTGIEQQTERGRVKERER